MVLAARSRHKHPVGGLSFELRQSRLLAVLIPKFAADAGHADDTASPTTTSVRSGVWTSSATRITATLRRTCAMLNNRPHDIGSMAHLGLPVALRLHQGVELFPTHS
jgi:hypothetical protein